MRTAATASASFRNSLGMHLDETLRSTRPVLWTPVHPRPAGASVPAFVPWPVTIPTSPPVRLLGTGVLNPVGAPRVHSARPTWKLGPRSLGVVYPTSAARAPQDITRIVDSLIPTVDSLFTGVEGSGLARTSQALKASNVSRLIRMVRDWTAPPRQVFPELRPVSEADHFRAQVLAADHRLLSRGPEKELWHWFLDWREQALRAEDSDLSATKLLKLLRRTLSRLRAGRRPASPVHRPPASGESLRRLADTIVGHAPPVPAPPIGSRRTEAG